MTPDEVRSVVRQVVLEERKNNSTAVDDAMLKTVSAILTSFGIPDDERKDIAEDFRYLRKWRLGAERIQGVGMTALVTMLVGGALSAAWLAVKAALGK